MDLYVDIASQRILSINKHVHMFMETFDKDKYFSQIFENFVGCLHPSRPAPTGHIFYQPKHASTFETKHYYFTRILCKLAIFHYITVFRMITRNCWSSHTIVEGQKARNNTPKINFLTLKTDDRSCCSRKWRTCKHCSSDGGNAVTS